MEWISVKEKLPENKIPFLGTDGDVVFACYWSDDCDEYKVGGWEGCNYCGGSSKISFTQKDYHTKLISNWMPLPPPTESD